MIPRSVSEPDESRGGDNMRAAFTQLSLGALSADETRGLTLLSEAEALDKGGRDDTVELPSPRGGQDPRRGGSAFERLRGAGASPGRVTPSYAGHEQQR